MDRKDNIFFRLTHEDENSTTEILCNLFRTKYVRDICFAFFEIPDYVYNSISVENIFTQISYGDLGIPDIVIQNQDSMYIIENKIRQTTGLQENQIENYKKIIERQERINSGYIFLIPKGYPEEKLSDLQKKYNNFIKIKKWEEFLSHLFNIELYKESPVINECLNYLRDTIIDKPEDTNLTPYEVAMLFNPRNILESMKLSKKVYSILNTIASSLTKYFGNQITLSTGRTYPPYSDFNSMGIFFDFNGKMKTIRDCIFVGFNFNLLGEQVKNRNNPEEEAEKYVYSICFQKESFNHKNLSMKDNFFDDGDFIYVKLCKENLLAENKEEKIKREIIEIIKNVFLNNVA